MNDTIRTELLITKDADQHVTASMSEYEDGTKYIVIRDHHTLENVVLPLATFQALNKAVENNLE